MSDVGLPRTRLAYCNVVRNMLSWREPCEPVLAEGHCNLKVCMSMIWDCVFSWFKASCSVYRCWGLSWTGRIALLLLLKMRSLISTSRVHQPLPMLLLQTLWLLLLHTMSESCYSSLSTSCGVMLICFVFLFEFFSSLFMFPISFAMSSQPTRVHLWTPLRTCFRDARFMRGIVILIYAWVVIFSRYFSWRMYEGGK